MNELMKEKWRGSDDIFITLVKKKILVQTIWSDLVIPFIMKLRIYF